MTAAIIGGTGIYAVDEPDLKPQTLETDYGTASLLSGPDLVFLNRHAPHHSVPPHRINARAQIDALAALGVKRVFAMYTVGAIHPDFEPGVPVILSDFIDFARRDNHTFYDTLDNAHGHVDMSQPFCPALAQTVLDTGLGIKKGGIYACTQGPRLESPAEIRALKSMGADVVGMTLSPEVPLARERGMSVCGIALPVNWAAGVEQDMTIDFAKFRAVQGQVLKAIISAARASTQAACTPAKIF